MARLEDLTPGARIKGIVPDGFVTVIDNKWHGTSVLELTYKDDAGRLGNELLFRDREESLEVNTAGSPWSFDADGGYFKLASEAHRINLAHLFDPLLAVHTSLVDPLPHQITAVYGEMLKRQPLRFLLADDPGAGKTIMTGLFIKELLIRGDLRRCLIVCPGMLAEQWQDELDKRFQLPFEILTNDKIEASRTGNWLAENSLVVCRLDKLSRDEELQDKLRNTDWDLIVCDEAHKMSASFFGGEVKETKRYKLGKLLSQVTRHFLLLTATPHNGKDEDFQLFLALLDGDRFEGRFRDGVHTQDASDLMRRMVKEQLVKFDGCPLFPARFAYTVSYKLSPSEAALYEQVTNYVREEFNRVEALENDGRKGTVGFALTILQRRLASSPEAIYQSLRRRKERLESRLREEKLMKRGIEARIDTFTDLPELTEDALDDLDDAPDSEVEATEEKVVDQATAARTIAELEAEIATLKRLEQLAQKVRQSGTDKKWDELSNLFQDNPHFVDADDNRRKIVIFTEHRDTLTYLETKIGILLGTSDAVVTIHGGVGREDRRKIQEAFSHDKDVFVMIATDAAGEGINLQRAHLMVNYDLPWNPNRLEQRFGRIHRIGQSEECHLWNLVAEETREADVFLRLFEKLKTEKDALGGAVFDVLGKTLAGAELRQLLIEAIRNGDRPEVKAKLQQQVDQALDHNRLKELIEEHALFHNPMSQAEVRKIKEDMERAEARKLQPHFISSFFQEAFSLLGGTIKEREQKRFEISRVPQLVKHTDRVTGTGAPVLDKYQRVTFHKDLINIPGKPMAAFLCPGHPLLDATMSLTLLKFRSLLKQGTILVDPNDYGDEPRVLFYLEHSIQDARIDRSGNRRVVSQQIQFVEVDSSGEVRNAGYAPYLDYRPLADGERGVSSEVLSAAWLNDNIESKAIGYAIGQIVPEHFAEVKRRKEHLIEKTMAAVKDRLIKEISYWDHRALELKQKELAGQTPKINSMRARERADELEGRLQKRMEELEQERKLSPLPPNVIGGALILPLGVILKFTGRADSPAATFARETARIERIAMDAIMQREVELGYSPRDVSKEKCGYDIESTVIDGGSLRFIEVKGRIAGAETVTVTKNEILTCLNKPEQFILAIVEVHGDNSTTIQYIEKPFHKEPDFAVTSINYSIKELMSAVHREDTLSTGHIGGINA